MGKQKSRTKSRQSRKSKKTEERGILPRIWKTRPICRLEKGAKNVNKNDIARNFRKHS